MLAVTAATLLLLALTTLIHYEALGLLNGWLPRLRIPARSKVLVVLMAAFAAHVLEMLLYGFALYGLVAYADAGNLVGSAGFSMSSCMYFSAETYTSLGFGDLAPVGPVRLIAGAEALNGLLLIGWSASYLYLTMERFWGKEKA